MGILGGILLLGSVIWVISRALRSAIGGSTQSIMLYRIKKNPAKGVAFAEQLDIPVVKKENTGADAARTVLQKLAACKDIKQYKVLYTQEVGTDQLLILTSLQYTDLDYGVGRSMALKDVTKTAYHEFVLKYDGNTGVFQVNSDLYDTTDSKLQKEAFARTVTDLLVMV